MVKFGWRWLLVILAVLIVLQIPYFASTRDVVRKIIAAPVVIGVNLVAKAESSIKTLTLIREIASDNQRLITEARKLEAKTATLQYLEAENRQLKQDLNFVRSRSEFSLTPAKVIAYFPSRWAYTVWIDKGRQDGLKSDTLALVDGYVVGKIAQVNEKSAELWLLGNRNLVLPVYLPDMQTLGLLKGTLKGLIIDGLSVDATYEAGESIVTADIDGIYLAGVPVGKVAEVLSAKNDIFQVVRVESPVQSAHFTTVYLVNQIKQ